MDSIIALPLDIQTPTLKNKARNGGLSFCGKIFSKGENGSSLMGMDACHTEGLLEQGMEVLEDTLDLTLTGHLLLVLPARHQSRPDTVLSHFVMGRPEHFDPTKYPCSRQGGPPC
eukprot:987006-Pelagomonas_calceolata.AAC.2